MPTVVQKAKLLEGLDISELTGLEIGALDRPFVPREEGNIFYVDHATTDALAIKYRNDQNVNVAKLVHVDGVWGDNTLSDAVGGRLFDYVIASHVIEHVPDMITWLMEIRAVLKEGGRIRLVIPDRRFTFDYLREETRLADLLYAHLIRARIPQPQLIIDFTLNASAVDSQAAWEDRIDPAQLEKHFPPDAPLKLARDVLDNQTYHDVHCWVFTPKSFARLLGQLSAMELLHFQCTNFHDTDRGQIEFFVSLQPSADREKIAQSWQEMEAKAIFLGQEISKSREVDLEEQLARACASLRELKGRFESAQFRTSALESSTSWKVTAPLRAARQMAHNFLSRRRSR